MATNTAIIDAATRFLRSNPELLDLARRGAVETGQPVEALLGDAVRRIRRSGFEAMAKEGVVVDHTAPRPFIVPSCEPWEDGETKLVS